MFYKSKNLINLSKPIIILIITKKCKGFKFFLFEKIFNWIKNDTVIRLNIKIIDLQSFGRYLNIWPIHFPIMIALIIFTKCILVDNADYSYLWLKTYLEKLIEFDEQTYARFTKLLLRHLFMNDLPSISWFNYCFKLIMSYSWWATRFLNLSSICGWLFIIKVKWSMKLCIYMHT